MSRLVKLLLPLAVLFPLVGFVVGSLVTAAKDEPPPRTPIVLREDSSDGPSEVAGPTGGTDEDDDHVVRPSPVEDDGDDEGEGTDDRDDEAGDDGDDRDDGRDDGGDDGDDD